MRQATQPVPVAEIDAHEGPVYVPSEDALYFTTLPRRDARGVPRVRIKRLSLGGDARVVREDANAANGMALARDGRLLVCEQGTPSTPARITAFDPISGDVEVLVDNWRGHPLASPNDVVEASDGAIWFTDPTYGFLQGFRPRPVVGDRVYRFEPDSGRLEVVADGLDKPNGLALSPDERTLYVTDSGVNQEPGSFYADRPHHVVGFAAPGGERLGEIELPGAVNFCFGGPGHNVLFITTDTAVHAAELEAKGA
jgi:gluconolactonase